MSVRYKAEAEEEEAKSTVKSRACWFINKEKQPLITQLPIIFYIANHMQSHTMISSFNLLLTYYIVLYITSILRTYIYE